GARDGAGRGLWSGCGLMSMDAPDAGTERAARFARRTRNGEVTVRPFSRTVSSGTVVVMGPTPAASQKLIVSAWTWLVGRPSCSEPTTTSAPTRRITPAPFGEKTLIPPRSAL